MAEEALLYLYISSVSSSSALKEKQLRIERILESKKIPFSLVDIAVGAEVRDKMREMCSNDKALPPQMFKGEVYLGDYEAFDEAVEAGELNTFINPTL